MFIRYNFLDIKLKMCKIYISFSPSVAKGLNARYYMRHLLIFTVLVGRHICIWELELLPEIFSSLALDENERGVAMVEG